MTSLQQLKLRLSRALRSRCARRQRASLRNHKSSCAVECLESRSLLSGITGGTPSLVITKGIVESTDPTAIYDVATGPSSVTFAEPSSNDHPFSGVIDSESIRTGALPQPLNANLTNANPGDRIRIAVLLENQASNGTAFDVSFRDTLPAGLTYVADSLQVVNGRGDALPFRDLDGATDGSGFLGTGILLDDPGATNGSFADPDHCGALDALSTTEPGRNIAIAFYDATVQNLAGNTALLNSDATLTGYAQSEGGANLATSTTDAAVITLERIDLELTKTVSNPSPLTGDIVTWTVDVTNNAANATSAATGVVVRDVVPSGQTVVPASAVFPNGGTFDEVTGVWTVGNVISPGATMQLTFQTVAGNSVSFTTPLVDVELNGSVVETAVAEGDSVVYTVAVTNNSEAATTTATGLVVSRLLPAGLNFVTHTASAGTFASGTGIWDLSAVTLLPGQTETITISTTAASGTAGTTIPIGAEVTALNETDIDSTANNTSISEDDDFTQSISVRAAAATRTISGKAFLDTDNNGVFGAEAGVSNITVNAYGPDGTLSGIAVTNGSGDYTIAGVTTEAIRLEFIGFDPTQSVTTAQSPPASVSTFSSLAFLDAGTGGLTANLALYQPTAQAQFVTTCFVYSGQTTLDPTVEPALVVFNADGSVKTMLASIAQVGATNGLAVHSFSGDRFAAAFQKRHSDMGPSGNSAIYRVTPAGTVSTFIQLDNVFGADSTGVYSHNPADWFTDAPAFSTIGTTSLGDVDISEDGQFLYTINLATRELIQIPIGSGGTNTPVDYLPADTRTVSAIPILGDDAVTPTNGGIPTGGLGADPTNNIRPFALAVKDGLIYVGMVNSAQSTSNDADLFAYVYAFDPATGQFSSTASTAFGLDSRTLGGGWQSWTNDWNTLPKFYESAGDYFTVGHNQPWLTDIEFDNNDDMILGFRDRTGDQVGHMVGDPTGADSDSNGSPDRFYHDTKGELLRVRKTGAATWTVEASHAAGDGTEYYDGDAPLFDPLAATLHPEAAQGGLVQVPGSNDIATTGIDPQSFWAGGVFWLDNATGAQTDALDLYNGSELPNSVSFGKNNGLGDLEFLNNLSMEIGNRIWNDVDSDGVQDAGEPALANVDVQLFDVSNPLTPLLVGTVTTNAAGEYYFNDSNVAYSDGADPVGLRALTDYEVRIAPAELNAGGTLDQFHVTTRDQAPVLVATTIQPVSGAAEFDSDINGSPDTARTQRIDVLTPSGLRADGVEVVLSNATGGFARVEEDGTVVFEFADGSVSGTFEYTIVDDRIDSDAAGFDDNADGITDRAIIRFTSGAAGTTDHSLDMGFSQAVVDLELSKLSERKLSVEGETVTFFVTLTNDELTGSLPATGVAVVDSIPAGLTFVPSSIVASQGTFDGTTWILPNPIPSGESETLSYQVTVDSGTAGSVLTNSAQVTSLNEIDIDSIINNDDGDRSEDDEDDAVLLIGTLTSTTTTNSAHVTAANESDFDSEPGNDDHDQSEDDESSTSYTLSTLTNVFDFGDLPDVYQTLAASGGPSHRRGTATFLGISIDDETDGLPSPTAIGDGPDEDGVRFLTPLLPDTTASIEVTTSTAGFLNAWIDYDGDTTFEELSITTIDGVPLGAPVAASDLALTAGVHTLAVAVPATATGSMAARFRYTNDQMASLRAPGGQWLNGEVEDYLLRQIGDRVWFDLDADGVIDPVSEAGLSGITVVLAADLDGDGTPENYPTTTDANGFYRFDGVPEGSYTVTVTPPASLVATFDLDGGNDDTAAVVLAPTTTSRLDVDFGYRGIGLIGDTIWTDTNANGTQDTGETGIASVAVQLTGDLNGDSVTDVTISTTSSATGIYEFQNLVPGNYTVTLTPPVGLVPTFDADSITTPHTSQTSLSIGTINRAQDFGYRNPASGGTGLIGDTVWLDLDADGLIDPGEVGLAGIPVQLTGDTNGDSIVDVTLSTTTNAIGGYEFASLNAGDYTVTVSPSAGLAQTFDADGLGTPNTSAITLAAGSTYRDQDFGYRGTGIIGDFVWFDADSDGVFDATESGIAGVPVQMTGDIDGDSVPDIALVTSTNAAGQYEFLNLPAADYIVTVTQPAITTQTFDADGLGTANTSSVTLAAAAINRDQDFGYRSNATGGSGLIGDTVWLDLDADGLQDIGEVGISGVPVQLTGDTNGDSVVDITLTTTTNAAGIYDFAGLAAGNYTVTITPPVGLTQTFDADGTTTANVSSIVLTAGGANRDQDFGYRGTGLIGDTIWFDDDSDGVLDTGEIGIAAVPVQLNGDLNGDSITDISLITISDASGLYAFTDLPPGTYTVLVTQPSGTTPTFDGDGVATANTSVIALGPGVTNRDQDFGYLSSSSGPTGLIGDTIWFDTDGDGAFDAGETGIGGLTVQLAGDTNGDTIVDVTQTTTTNSSGIYEFTGLGAGVYTVTVVPPSGTVPTFDADGIASPNTSMVTLTAGTTVRTQDFGYQGTGLIGDRIWFDADLDGTQDPGEPGLPGVAVQLAGDLNGDAVTDVVLNAVTTSTGNYEFVNLAPGNYSVSVTPPAGSIPTFDADGIATPHVSTTALAAGAVIRTLDFGYAGTATVGDSIFSDVDNSNSQTTGDTGIPGIGVILTLDINGDSIADFTTSTVTDAAGLYSFGNLLPGTYALTVDPATLTGANSPVVDPDGTNNGTTSVILTAGTTNLNQDFGYPAATSTPTTIDLIITKDNDNAQDIAAIGSVITYSIIVSNAGPADAVNAVVTDTLPSQFTSAIWTASGSAGSIFNAAGTGSLAESVSIPSGGNVTFSVAAQLNTVFSGFVTNTATVTTTQTDTDLTNNTASDVTSVSPLTLTPETAPLPGEPFQIGARGMSHVALVPFIVGTTLGPGTINGVTVGIADPEVFMVGFVCIDDRIIAVHNIPASRNGQTLYYQAYEAVPTPRLSNIVQATVGGPRVIVVESGDITAVTEGSTSDSVSMALSEAPSANVIVNIQSQNPGRVVATPGRVTFTPANWNVVQSVSVQAVDDAVVNGDKSASLNISVDPGSDPGFVTSFAQSVTVEVTDNDVLQKPGLTNSFTATNNQQPAITWSAVAGASSYDVWISPSADVQNPSTQTTVVGTSFTPPAPLGIGRHAVWVRARSASGEVSAWSTGARIEVKTPASINPVADGIDTTPTITWNAIDGATRYEVWINNLTTGVSKVVHSSAVTSTSFTPSTALGFGVHAVWVRGINQYGQSSNWSVAETFYVGPELLSPVGPTFESQPTFSWTAIPDAASFEIYIQSGGSFLQQTGITTTTFTPAAPLADGLHRWWIRGYAANGKSGKWSDVAEVTTGGRPSVLNPVNAGTAATATVFEWTPVAGAARYSLYVSRTDIPGLAYKDENLTTTNYTHTPGFSPGNYRVWVQAIKADGTKSPWSVPVDYTVAAIDPPLLPGSHEELEHWFAAFDVRLRNAKAQPDGEDLPLVKVEHASDSARPAEQRHSRKDDVAELDLIWADETLTEWN